MFWTDNFDEKKFNLCYKLDDTYFLHKRKFIYMSVKIDCWNISNGKFIILLIN